jgi:predicted O-linked N-acetylglucosamine transferase (SPINDLY family)
MFAWFRSKRPHESAANAGTPAAIAEAVAALPALRRAVSAADREAAVAEFHLGGRQLAANRPEAAERHFRRALQLNPGFAEAYANLGALLKEQGQPGEAERLLTLAVELQPALAPACFNLAMLCIGQSRWVDAAVLLKRSLAADPAQADAQYWLGNALMGQGDAKGARAAYLASVGLDGNYVQARWGHVMAQLPAVPLSKSEQAQAPAAFARELDKLRAWFRAHPSANGHLAVGAQQPYYLAYIAQNHREVLSNYGSLCADLMAAWAKRAGMPAPSGSGLSKKRRVAIVSAHIHNHSVWHALLRGWVEHLDRGRFELQIFHTGSGRDAETEWARRRVAKLHHGLGGWAEWAQAIAESRADILIYPEIGMDATTIRLSALRLAPVQLASWGHPLSSGLPTIDGYISAQAFEPPEGAAHYSEKLLTLPRLGCSYQRFGTRPSPLDFAAWGIQATDKVLLCAGTPYKYAPEHDAVWAEIARRCAPCKLVFFHSTTETLSARLEQRLRTAFASSGVAFDDCVRFIPWQTQAAFFALLDRADVYLDTIGFSGFNTTMQAIERGTPVVAFEGEFMRGRFASAILRQLGLERYIATSVDQFVQLAERLACDHAERQRVKSEIHARSGQLFDDRDTVKSLETEIAAFCR